MHGTESRGEREPSAGVREHGRGPGGAGRAQRHHAAQSSVNPRLRLGRDVRGTRGHQATAWSHPGKYFLCVFS